ncbi:hypothetical protein [Clostridium pasteurianum]|uniref:hypothetical protein n=1 Tax=Clostridium pasteurianum TaxID=1501 RepID=UPI00082416D1|nr:hypothetical protein [Clostridium pasteurianum]PJI07278.1 hypothetical protein CUB90_05100 [Clostridium sp. CT7]
MLARTGAIAYFSIGHAIKANKQYELFAQKYGCQFDKAQGNPYYRDNSKNHTDMSVIHFVNIYKVIWMPTLFTKELKI